MSLVTKHSGKTLSIHIQNDPAHLGPNGQLLLYGTPENPAVISGQVVFETDHTAKGDDLEITYSAMLGVEWADKAENCLEGFVYKIPFEQRKFSVALKHVAPSKIKAGKYSANIHFPVSSSFPSSMYLYNAFVVYKIHARIPRKSPSSDIVQEQIVWILNSNISEDSRSGERLLTCLVPECSKDRVKTSNEPVLSETPGTSYTCEIPTTCFIAGETVALVVESAPELELERDAASIYSTDDKKPPLLKWPGESPDNLVGSSSCGGQERPHRHSQDEAVASIKQSKVPDITVRLKQTTTYWNRDRSATQREHREFASFFRLDKEMVVTCGGRNDGWQVVLKTTLPRLGAKRVELHKEEVQDELEGLKASLDHQNLRIDHLLQIDLKFDTGRFSSKVHMFSIPVTIIAPCGPGVIPFRFGTVSWSFKSAGTTATYSGAGPAHMDSISYNAKLAQTAATVLSTVHRS
ncbi:hypothetical protein EDD21DRAFT_179618 [Dissophora ornata]|nr:hypothetical protein BGZ58_008118 [Dissophora ornata]KAI8598731.1 hypothetical protein EDD21DRAFT_179618 [Dissophora ornata]